MGHRSGNIQDARKLMQYAITDYNMVKPHSSTDFLPSDEFERRLHADEGLGDKFPEDRKRNEEGSMKKQD